MGIYYGVPNNRTREVITASDGNDDIYPLGGWDIVQGKGGIDTVFVQGQAAQYRVLTEEGITYINALSGASAGSESTQLYDVEYIRFDDQTIDLTLPKRFEGTDSSQLLIGNAGTDTVVYQGPQERYRVERSGEYYFVTDLQGAGGVDRLRNIERVEFNNGKLALDLTGDARDAARLVGTLLGPEAAVGPLANKAIVGAVIGLFDRGDSLAQVAQLALGALGWNTETLIRQVFVNALGRSATAEELTSLLGALQGTPVAEVARLACDLGLVDAQIGLTGLADTGLSYI
ncbi:MAG: hypothetical protein ACKOCJ_04775 [Burkholderiaceae bacterium]